MGVKACTPGGHCERSARDLGGCVAGYCNPPAPAPELHSNSEPAGAFRVRAICQCCGHRSRPVKPDDSGEPDLWAMGRGWSCAPFHADTRHADGSVGSFYTCPACNKRLRAGERLTLRAYGVTEVAPAADADLAAVEKWLANGGAERAVFFPRDAQRLGEFVKRLVTEVRATRGVPVVHGQTFPPSGTDGGS